MYQYQACGLDNVWLENGYVEKQTPYGKAVSVANADQLHELLAMRVAGKSGHLSGKEFRFLRNSMCLSQRALGEMLGVSEQTVSLWEREESAIPVAQETVVRMLALEKIKGNGKIGEIIERVNTVERLVNQRIVARAMDHKWTAKAEDEAPEIEATC